MLSQLFNTLNIFSIYGELYFIIFLLLLIFLIIPYAILIVVAIWVYRDAKQKGLNAVVWVIIIWITPFFIGLIFYMVNRNKTEIEAER